MIMQSLLTIRDYLPEYRSCIQKILTKIGWAEGYISAMENAVDVFSKEPEIYGVYLAPCNGEAIGYLYIQYHAWNQLCQIQGLAVSAAFQRQGAASALVAGAEEFARSKNARGVYVNTPTTNMGERRFYEAVGYQLGYIMPCYYEDGVDRVTYQKFFDG